MKNELSRNIEEKILRRLEQCKAYCVIIPRENFQALMIVSEFEIQLKNIKNDIEKQNNRSQINSNSILTSREIEVLSLVSIGHPNKEIAYKLSISIKTIEYHLKNILKIVNRRYESIEDGFVDLRLKDGTRISIAIEPITLNGPTLLIRKVFSQNISFDELISWKVIDQNGKKLCQKLIANNSNIILAGNLGSGKTTMANIFVKEINKEHRIITAEKIAEIDTSKRKRTLRLVTPNTKQSEMVDLLQKAAMLRADNFIINELQGAEAFEATKLMREGYSVLATIMAEGASDALKKCELYCLMSNYGIGIDEIKYHLSTAVDIVVFQERLSNGKRVLSNISKVDGIDDSGKYVLIPLFIYDSETESFITTVEGNKYLNK